MGGDPRARCLGAMTPRWPSNRTYYFPCLSGTRFRFARRRSLCLPNWQWVVPTHYVKYEPQPTSFSPPIHQFFNLFVLNYFKTFVGNRTVMTALSGCARTTRRHWYDTGTHLSKNAHSIKMFSRPCISFLLVLPLSLFPSFISVVPQISLVFHSSQLIVIFISA